MKRQKPQAGIIMGSSSDWATMREAAKVLEEARVPFETMVVSAHRTPNWMSRYAKTAEKRGIQVIIAGAGGSAHLPGMTAAHTLVPVIGVPVKTQALDGLDSFLSMVQMPGGIPVACTHIGSVGATQAGHLALRILQTVRPALRSYLKKVQRKSRKRGPS